MEATEPDSRVTVPVPILAVGLVVGMLQQSVLIAVVSLVIEYDDLALAGAWTLRLSEA